jgi:uncharacterized protein YhjY with autotransporter beta-barrel domain
MGIGLRKVKMGWNVMRKLLMAVIFGAGISSQSHATTNDATFLQYMQDACAYTGPTAGWDITSLTALCGVLASSGGSGGAVVASEVSSNLGTVNAGGNTSSRKKRGIRVPIDEPQADKGASADDAGWGVLVAPQYGKSIRSGTDLENGYQSKLSGVMVGLDYRSSDSFIAGVAFAQTRDKANFEKNTGYLNSNNTVVTLFSTWLFSDSAAADGYLGMGKLGLDNQRRVGVGTGISGSVNGSTTGRQVMAGMSINSQFETGKFDLSPFLNIDYISSKISGYREIGSDANANLLALRYGDRSVASLASSLGGRLSAAYRYEWGELTPSVRLSAVHEFQNKSKQISNELIITPGLQYSVETDSPDQNFLNIGLAISAALSSGGQLFFDFEKRTQDKLLSSWAVSLGGLFEF